MARQQTVHGREKTKNADSTAPRDAKARLNEAIQETLVRTRRLYWKTHVYHWNVTGPSFSGLHRLLEDQYKALWAFLDEIAETIRTFGSSVDPAHSSNRALPGTR